MADLLKEVDRKKQNRLRLVILLLVVVGLGLCALIIIFQGSVVLNLAQGFLLKPAAATTTRPAIAPATTLTPTLIGATATLVIPLESPTITVPQATTPATPSTPSATSTRVNTPTITITPTVAVVASPSPSKYSGSIAYHKNENGIDSIFVFNTGDKSTTSLVDIGDVTDLQFNTHAPIGVWSPDNTRFAYISTFKHEGAFTLRVIDIASHSNTPLFTSQPTGGLFSPTWSPDGKQIAFVQFMRLRENQTNWSIDLANANGALCNGKSICELRANNQGEQYHGGLTWSSQGILAIGLNSSGGNDIYTMFADGSAIFQLTDNPAEDSLPAWSPDGKQIAFTSTRDGHYQIYVMDANGGNLRRVSHGDSTDFAPTWSPDGKWLAYTSVRDGAPNIYIMDLNGNNVTRVTTTGGDRPSWSR